MSKGSSWRKGHSFAKFQNNFDNIFPQTKTSAEWLNQDYKNMQILSPDGWDNENWEYSFYQEKISKLEFEKRLLKSKIVCSPADFLPKK